MLKEKIRNILAKRHSEQELESWFHPLKIQYLESTKRESLNNESENSDVIVIFPHAFFSNWFFSNTNGFSSFKKAIDELGLNTKNIRYIVTGSKNSTPELSSEKSEKKISSHLQLKKIYLGEEQIYFSDLVYNSKNFFPVNLAKEISGGQKNLEYNPLIFHGNDGTGKTSLLMAMVLNFSERIKKDNIYLGTIDELDSLYQNAKNRQSARSSLKNCQVFLIDELQSLSDKPKLQKELSALFDLFKEQGCQMVVCSNQKISSMNWLTENLFTRLCSGICLELKEPDLDVRIKYIQKKCELFKFNLNPEQIIAIAHKNPGFRPINGVLLKIKAYLEAYNNKMNDDDFDNLINSTAIVNRDSSGHESIIKTVADNFGFTISEILSEKRQQNLVMARQVAMYICRKNLNLSYPIIGRIFGGRDHTTVLHATKKIDKSMLTNKDMHSLVTKLLKMCNSKK